jgi:hypothetical protein
MIRNIFTKLCLGVKHYLHTLVLSIYAPLALYANNIGETPFNYFFYTAILCIIFGMLVYGLLRIVFRDRGKAAVLASIFLAMFYVLIPLSMNLPAINIHIRKLYLGLLFAVIFVLIFYCISKNKISTAKVGRFLSVVCVFLVIGTIYPIARFHTNASGRMQEGYAQQLFGPLPRGADKLEDKPDVYYIILDAYGSKEGLAKFYGYNNQDFVAQLSARNFKVCEGSLSNYPYTIYSVPSSLNMSYLENKNLYTVNPHLNMKRALCIYKHNRLESFFKTMGYKTFFMSYYGFYDVPSSSKSLWERFIRKITSPFTITLLVLTPLSVKLDAVFYGEVQNRLDALEAISKLQGPKFTFSHIYCPHPQPSRDLALNKMSLDMEKKNYIKDLQDLNPRVLKVVDTILRNSTKPPIIVIQGDHGWTFPSEEKKLSVSEFYACRYGILNAYYLPNGGEKILYKGITPVNSFRMILNYYFGTQLERLPDFQYFVPGVFEGQPKDVTGTF